MAWKYARIWAEVKRTQQAVITVHGDMLKTTIQGIKRTKSSENVNRPLLGNSKWPKLAFDKELIDSSRDLYRLTIKFEIDLTV